MKVTTSSSETQWCEQRGICPCLKRSISLLCSQATSIPRRPLQFWGESKQQGTLLGGGSEFPGTAEFATEEKNVLVRTGNRQSDLPMSWTLHLQRNFMRYPQPQRVAHLATPSPRQGSTCSLPTPALSEVTIPTDIPSLNTEAADTICFGIL